MQEVTEERGLSVHSSLNDDLVQIMKDNIEAVCTAHPPGTFGRVFTIVCRERQVCFDVMHVREDLTYDTHTGGY